MASLIWAYQIFCLQLFLLYSQSSAVLCSQDQSSALLQFMQLFSFVNHSSFDCDYYAQYSYLFNFESPPYCDGRCPSYPKTLSWKEDVDCCTWNGVTCDIVTGQVIGLDLSCGWLHGYIPSNSTLFLLRHLQSLNLAFNDFIFSQISSDFSQLTSLTHLNLSSSNFSGRIPSEISHLSNLVSLDLSSFNFFSYEFNNSLRFEKTVLDGLVQNLTKLTKLDLDNVDMSTITPSSFMNLSSLLTLLSLNHCGLQGKFPDKIFHLPSLKLLSLADNFNLTGTLPNVNWSDSMEYLDVSNMIFSGELSNSIGNLISLRHLDLFNCSFVGSVPASLGNLTQLTFLRLTSNEFSGPIPAFLSKLTMLRVLGLSINNFSGEFPDIFANTTQLSHLSLADDQLVGPLPSDGSKFQNLVSINLMNNSFNGSLPSWLLNLPLLEYVDLGYNKLTGSLKDGFQSNSLKVIRLLNNMLHGPIPISIFELVNLTQLDLSSNNLNGSVEVYKFAKLKKLEFLLLDSNLIQGTFPIPPPNLILFSLSNNKLTGKIPLLICNMRTIEILNFSNNSLSGTIPECLGNISSLHVLDMRKNRFYGNVPGAFAKGNHLRTLDLNDNGLEGPLPRSLVNCRMLEVLDLGNNKINDSFPQWLENLPKLQVLVLRSNNFYGKVQDSSARNSSFPMLRIFDLSNNKFTGFLPRGYLENLKAMMNLDNAKRKLNYMGETHYQDSVLIVVKGFEIILEKIITTFTIIDFSNNNFQGEIPESITKLHSLRLLNLSQNNLSGHIPISIGNLAALESLDLSSNKLVGEIPSQMTSLTFLAVLNLSQNQLVGPIPRGNQFETFKNNSYIGNPRLCGFSLPNKCDDDEASPPKSLMLLDEDQNISSWFDWKVIMMGYGCGLLLGLFIGYTVFSTGKPQWFHRTINRAIRKCESGRRKGKTKRKWCS